MQIQLQQTEIEKALKQFIQSQGISLDGRTVEMSFTAGRRNNGVTVDLNIQDQHEQIDTTIGGPNTAQGPSKREQRVAKEVPTGDTEPDSAQDTDSDMEIANEDTPDQDAESTESAKGSLFGT